MPVDPVFAAAFYDGSQDGWAPRRILGVRLRKFSLWHRFTLRVIESPFLCAGEVTMRDLSIALGVCRLSFGDSCIRKPRLWPFLCATMAVGRTVFSRKDRTAKEGENPAQRALRSKVDDFLSYCGDYLQSPEYAIIPPERTGEPQPRIPRGRAPEEIEQVAEIVYWSKCKIAAAWNMPVGQANIWTALARRDAGHDISFTTMKEKEFQKTLPASYRHR